jgi:hypothetical protein
MHDARFAREIVIAIQPFVMQPVSRAISRRRNGAASAGAADDFGREVKDCHDGNPSTLQRARRNDV